MVLPDFVDLNKIAARVLWYAPSRWRHRHGAQP
nr:MAG TPA: hypothetical protein [Caudoviricetes sp.]